MIRTIVDWGLYWGTLSPKPRVIGVPLFWERTISVAASTLDPEAVRQLLQLLDLAPYAAKGMTSLSWI